MKTFLITPKNTKNPDRTLSLSESQFYRKQETFFMNYFGVIESKEEEVFTTLKKQLEDTEDKPRDSVIHPLYLRLKDKNTESEFNKYYKADSKKWFTRGLLIAVTPLFFYFLLGLFGFEFDNVMVALWVVAIAILLGLVRDMAVNQY